jgi:hypothetical protein
MTLNRHAQFELLSHEERSMRNAPPRTPLAHAR